jgi:hypothetical protein
MERISRRAISLAAQSDKSSAVAGSDQSKEALRAIPGRPISKITPLRS